jgi:hypothetical protein
VDTTKCNGLTAGNSQPVKTYSKKLNPHIVPFPDTSGNCDKPNLIARFTHAGDLVHGCSEQGSTVIHPRWRMRRYCEDFAAVTAFARTVGVKHGL